MLGQACAKTGWQIHAYCLMSNHFHLALETPQPNLVAGIRWMLGSYPRETDAVLAERLVPSGLVEAQWNEADLKRTSRCLVFVAGVVSVAMFLRFLRLHHPSVWRELGEADISRSGSIRLTDSSR